MLDEFQSFVCIGDFSSSLTGKIQHSLLTGTGYVVNEGRAVIEVEEQNSTYVVGNFVHSSLLILPVKPSGRTVTCLEVF